MPETQRRHSIPIIDPPSLAHRRREPRSLEPIVRRRPQLVDMARRRGNRSAVLTQSVQVKFYSLANCLLGSSKSVTGSDASGEIWHIRRVISASIFNNDRVTHENDPISSVPIA